MLGGVRRFQPYADTQPTRHRFYAAVQYEVPYDVDDGQISIVYRVIHWCPGL